MVKAVLKWVPGEKESRLIIIFQGCQISELIVRSWEPEILQA